MRDSRVIVWNTTVHDSTTGTLNGPDINLLDGKVWNGETREGTGRYGVRVVIIVNGVTLGTDADGFLSTWKWQVAPDASGVAGTYVDGPTIGTIAYDETNGFTKDGTLAGAALNLTRAKLQSTLRTTMPWARLVQTPTDVEGTCVYTTQAYLSDGVHPFADTGRIS